MKKLFIPLLFAGTFLFSGCDTLNSIARTTADVLTEGTGSKTGTYTPSILDMGNGLKSALNAGITNGANRLSLNDGYFGNSLL
ncbi:MAG: hypothetical protein ACI8ZX_002807, partial [Planctomycetota bacterium]